MSSKANRDRWLAQSDAELLAQCEVDTYRASGPGGQKRNKTSSAVRLRHGPSGQLVIAEESRSQHENKAKALRRLRKAIALSIRVELPTDWKPPEMVTKYLTGTGRLEISTKNEDYPPLIAVVLDVVAACRGQLRESAEQFGITTAQLSRFIQRDGKLMDAVNQIRKAAGLKVIVGSP
jgi:DNA-binding phage protein